ncbi:potassium-transporting ATPase subunit KdpA [Micromonospora carbonacea]|uniref:potassium-transporting ATPase subunit KdpA n=1 Tax=Micromonospora carbonacea TaxID=47853 RepID=UPI00371ADBB2
MTTTTAGVLSALSLVAALAVAYRPFGDHLYRVVAGTRHARVERVVYRLVGVDPAAGQTWGVYARAVLAFSAVSILFLYAFQRVQDHLWLSLGFAPVVPHGAWNTAVSFVTNTNWQWYSGESTMGHLVQMAGLAVQNFVSAAVGIAVAVALVRGFARGRTGELGNFWVDLTRIVLRVLLPVAVLGALVLMLGGVVQNLSAGTDVTTLTGGTQTITGGPVASQEVIKELGTNGGGFYNANSAHPFENPTAWTNWLEIFLLLVIPFSLPRVFGRMVGQHRQGYAIAAVMAVLAVASVALTNVFELAGHGTVPQAVGAALEGKEVRFGVSGSATFAAATTLTSTGAVNSFHDSYTALGGMMPLVNMMLGEVAPGGVGSGLYGMLVLAVITVFVAGLMVGRTPEYVGKRIGAREIKLASLYFLVTPALVLTGTAAAFATGNDSTALNTGPHGLSEVLYAFTSASNNNGSAFAGITVGTPWWNTALGLCMLLGRFLPIIFVLALAGALARQTPTPATEGTLPTHRPLFVGMVVGVTVLLVALTFLPALALGPLAEGL